MAMTRSAMLRTFTGMAWSGSGAGETGGLCSEFIRISAPMADALWKSKRRSLRLLHARQGHFLVDIRLQALGVSHVGATPGRVALDALHNSASVERRRVLRIGHERFVVISERLVVVLLAEVDRAA